jgi:hypothetical protein
MREVTKVALAVLAIGAAIAYTRWPRINDVETGRTPEYDDLRIQRFTATEERVTRSARAAGLDARTRVLRFKDDVTVRIRKKDDLTEVSVRSRSRVGKADFGQNARNIRAFQAELERQMLQP